MTVYGVIGSGYVGLNLAVALAKLHHVIVYDTNAQRIAALKNHTDTHGLQTKEQLSNKNLCFVTDIADLKPASILIVSVPTPLDNHESPDIRALKNAMHDLATVLKVDDIVILESTVYPGTTENVCIPLLEKLTGLEHGKGFHVGYSPERISPGDAAFSLENLTKIIAAQDKKTLQVMREMYESICAKVYPVSSIMTAEVIKLLENIQRDVNIAVMNEMAQVLHALNVDMHEVVEGAKTKRGFVPFRPGLVGGHCIPVDPLYMVFKAKQLGLKTDMIQTARRINDGLTDFIIQSMRRLLDEKSSNTHDIKIGIFGVSYKENVPDIRHSLSIKLIEELIEQGFDCYIHDPLSASIQSDIKMIDFDELKQLSVALITVGHDFYKQIGVEAIISTCEKGGILMDIPNIFVDAKKSDGVTYWHL